MLRLVSAALKDNLKKLAVSFVSSNNIQSNFSTQIRCLSVLTQQCQTNINVENNLKLGTGLLSNSLSKLLVPKIQLPITQSRTVTKFSLKSGKRKSVKTVLKRFYRLNWGIWIRTKAGRHKRLWKKSPARRLRLKQHVFTNSTQSWMLDKMVTKYWKRPKYYVDDIYEPYHSREEFPFTQRKPKPLPDS